MADVVMTPALASEEGLLKNRQPKEALAEALKAPSSIFDDLCIKSLQVPDFKCKAEIKAAAASLNEDAQFWGQSLPARTNAQLFTWHSALVELQEQWQEEEEEEEGELEGIVACMTSYITDDDGHECARVSLSEKIFNRLVRFALTQWRHWRVQAAVPAAGGLAQWREATGETLPEGVPASELVTRSTRSCPLCRGSQSSTAEDADKLQVLQEALAATKVSYWACSDRVVPERTWLPGPALRVPRVLAAAGLREFSEAPASPESEGEAEPTAAQADPEDLGDGHVTKLKEILLQLEEAGVFEGQDAWLQCRKIRIMSIQRLRTNKALDWNDALTLSESQEEVLLQLRKLAKQGVHPLDALAGNAVPEEEPEEPVLDSFDVAGVAKYLKDHECKDVVVMCGAGLSTAAGIPDFRTPGTGLYDTLQRFNLSQPEAIFELDFFRQEPGPFYELCRELWPGRYKPTLGHYFIKLLLS
ncbi:NAD-dependent protein deacetylase sirtuin-2 [Symbiodinium microadriaticum]|uniref:NAD-dependent protein deacetylase sirtuin-2 n=1 Tax=Symbiodinium microadriaticum TaxID=2951 RepID=A0A1Q9EDU5_SYMMI|nr:NAD-dependent protein deacetylase sirtuin-2 [Symbiodinium microadriaticum]